MKCQLRGCFRIETRITIKTYNKGRLEVNLWVACLISLDRDWITSFEFLTTEMAIFAALGSDMDISIWKTRNKCQIISNKGALICWMLKRKQETWYFQIHV